MTGPFDCEIRSYRSCDASATLAVFRDAVMLTASKDYTPEQIAAWAGQDNQDLDTWDKARRARSSFVACLNGEIIGFTDVDGDGYIEMLFVAPRYGRQGVATAMLDHVERIARKSGAPTLSANVSVTALRFFKHRGFIVQAVQHPTVGGVQLTNHHMTKNLR